MNLSYRTAKDERVISDSGNAFGNACSRYVVKREAQRRHVTVINNAILKNVRLVRSVNCKGGKAAAAREWIVSEANKTSRQQNVVERIATRKGKVPQS